MSTLFAASDIKTCKNFLLKGWIVKKYLIPKLILYYFFFLCNFYESVLDGKALGKWVEEDSKTHERAYCKDTTNKVTLLIMTIIIFGGS